MGRVAVLVALTALLVLANAQVLVVSLCAIPAKQVGLLHVATDIHTARGCEGGGA